MFNEKNIERNKKKKGFTLAELMITVLIISVGLVGIILLIQNTLRSALSVRLNLTAVYLAQEGVELTKNIRDTNWINNNDWKENLNHCENGCQIGYNEENFVLYQDTFLKVSNDGFYSYNLGSDSKFKRKITIKDSGDFFEVESTVFWEYEGKENKVEVVGHLYDWI